jgi:hypothetical protein
MRKEPTSDSEDDTTYHRGRKHLMKKHPNKHAEGDRKRWRDEITERERKRYLAVWASNKGLYATNGAIAPFNMMQKSKHLDLQAISNLVVRDIFKRSRLSFDVLAEVYNLVDRQKNGGLSREEFVVGLWLIDQHLKGRKLPIRVSLSVWQSASGLGGIRVPRR